MPNSTGIAWILTNRGFDAIHTDDLPDKERTTDSQIRKIANKENRIVITKDSDFVDSHYISGTPEKIVIIATGNIKNKELYSMFSKNLSQIIDLLDKCDLVEMNNFELIGHE